MTYKERYGMKENSISKGDKKSAPAFTGALQDTKRGPG